MAMLGSTIFDVTNRTTPILQRESKYGAAPEILPGQPSPQSGSSQKITSEPIGFLKPITDFFRQMITNPLISPEGGGGGGGTRGFGTTLSTAAAHLSRAATTLERAQVTVNTTVNLDGRVIARVVSTQQSRNLSRASRGYGYSSGGVVT